MSKDKALAQVSQDVISRVDRIMKERPLVARQMFRSELNQPCPSQFIKKDRGVETLPISYVEAMLDAYYLGDWSTANFRWQIVVNEIVGSIDLIVKHPITGDQRKLSGAGAIQIMVNRGSDFTDVNNKKPNALEMGFPKLQAMCLKNAAKHLGKRFGRDLNRKAVAGNFEVVKTTDALLNEIVEEA